MKRVSITHHRGYRIEGVKQGGGLLLRVIPTGPYLPILKYSRFRTVRAPWDKAVGVVVGLIDETLREALHQRPANELGGSFKIQTDAEEVSSQAALRELEQKGSAPQLPQGRMIGVDSEQG